jgi:hypothetical protein
MTDWESIIDEMLESAEMAEWLSQPFDIELTLTDEALQMVDDDEPHDWIKEGF